MKLPKKIHFAGFDYTVEEVDRLDGNESWGRSDMGNQKIFIEKGMSDDKKIETLIHEMLHVAIRHTGLMDKKTKEEEETLVRSWSMNIFGILKDNGFLNIDLFNST